MLKAWLFGVGILFVLAEFSIWLKQFILPLPIYILAGAFLAIASNYERGLISLFRQLETEADALTQTATLIEMNNTPSLNAKALPVVKVMEGQQVTRLPEAD